MQKKCWEKDSLLTFMESNMDIDFKDIQIDYYEVLRYLGYNGQHIGKNLKNIIYESINLTKDKINPRYILRVYPIERRIKVEGICSKKYLVELKGTNMILDSKDIYNLLEGCSECIVMAATLGVNIEREIKKYSYVDLTKGIVIDSCATTAIEGVCNLIENTYRRSLTKHGKYLTTRYSPGYGDLSIESNREFINLLSSQNKIGLTITASNIMIPRKSVIAIAGISETNKSNNKKSCLSCNNYNHCKYRKEDEGCEN